MATYDRKSSTSEKPEKPTEELATMDKEKKAPRKIQQLIQWLQWRHACLDEEISEAEKEERRLMAEKEVLYEDMENMYLRLYSVGKKIRQMNKKNCSCPDESNCTCQKQITKKNKAKPCEPETDTTLRESTPVPLSGHKSTSHSFQGNQRYVSVMHTKEEPFPKMHLFKFHSSISQCMLDGKESPSSACALICKIFAVKFKRYPSEFDHERHPLRDIPTKVFDQVVESIQEGNRSHSNYHKGEMAFLSAENIEELTSHLATRLVKQLDIDTRVPDTMVPHVMTIKDNEVILFAKSHRVVSLFSHKGWLWLFDSQRHIVSKDKSPKYFGSYLFYAKKEETVIKNMFQSYDTFCELKPFSGKFAIFEI